MLEVDSFSYWPNKIENSNDALNIIVKSVFYEEFIELLDETAQEKYCMTLNETLTKHEDSPMHNLVGNALSQMADDLREAILDFVNNETSQIKSLQGVK